MKNLQAHCSLQMLSVTFGTVNGNIFADQTDFIATYEEEARRYYTNIVGKYGPQVQKCNSQSFWS